VHDLEALLLLGFGFFDFEVAATFKPLANKSLT